MSQLCHLAGMWRKHFASLLAGELCVSRTLGRASYFLSTAQEESCLFRDLASLRGIRVPTWAYWSNSRILYMDLGVREPCFISDKRCSRLHCLRTTENNRLIAGDEKV